MIWPWKKLLFFKNWSVSFYVKKVFEIRFRGKHLKNIKEGLLNHQRLVASHIHLLTNCLKENKIFSFWIFQIPGKFFSFKIELKWQEIEKNNFEKKTMPFPPDKRPWKMRKIGLLFWREEVFFSPKFLKIRKNKKFFSLKNFCIFFPLFSSSISKGFEPKWKESWSKQRINITLKRNLIKKFISSFLWEKMKTKVLFFSFKSQKK